METKFRGIIPPVSTILSETGGLDRDGMGLLVDKLIGSGVDGLFFLGSGGEFSQMSVEERKAVAEFAVKHVNKRVPVLIGTGSSSTREVIELSLHSKEIGADGVVVINPYYWPLSNENLFKHYSEIAKNVELPIILYNFPGLSGQDLSPDFVLSLIQQYSNIVGIKETVDSIGHIREMILKVKKEYPNFSVLCGYDDHLVNTLSLGGDGAISASGNFAPQLTIGIYQAFQEGDLTKMVELHQQLAFIPLMYKLDSPFVNVIKEAIKLTGPDISTHVLPPAQMLSFEKKARLKEILRKASLL
ncbi:dihydrodipicolinate synthase family protein [Aquibacillus albus]|uniref:4-hydroxy-tetrahydrodipicolinate synthase n=1 Tax=Aquibacillus albus TaxID=1168171 RepID=A0ABS2N614_9BACI|nr:4-hydroxy-tetrahydrodipicolinate synthase [Aquibacillus albus]